ncbi:MAG: IS110 family transposase [Rhizobiales bacterium]|nr:IS110 family transposase [Hyphomicrobiales bacterium]
MIIHPGFVGIDVSKPMLDVFDAAIGRSECIDNTSAPIAALVARWRSKDVFVLFEATGSYDRLLRDALTEAGIRFARVNPARARDFARSAGFLAKTDAIDARMLAAMAQCLAPEPQAAANPVREQLARAHKRRDQLVYARQKERTRRSECVDPDIAADIDDHLDWLDHKIVAWDREIDRLIQQSEELAQAARRLRSMPGFGPVATTTLLALMPELGTLSPKAAAAIAGLAPFNIDSGQFRGSRRIKGGRKRVRDALYMAALAAARCNSRFRAFYRSLRAAGKPAKVAIIAVARKLLITANAILRDKSAYQR